MYTYTFPCSLVSFRSAVETYLHDHIAADLDKIQLRDAISLSLNKKLYRNIRVYMYHWFGKGVKRLRC